MRNVLAQREHEKKVKSEEKKRKDEEVKQAYKDLFNSPLGRIVMKDMAKDANHRKDVFAISNSERENNYLQGKQSIITRILKILED